MASAVTEVILGTNFAQNILSFFSACSAFFFFSPTSFQKHFLYNSCILPQRVLDNYTYFPLSDSLTGNSTGYFLQLTLLKWVVNH